MKFNERTASIELARTIEQNKQDDVRAINREAAKKESDRKESVNMQF